MGGAEKQLVRSEGLRTGGVLWNNPENRVRLVSGVLPAFLVKWLSQQLIHERPCVPAAPLLEAELCGEQGPLVDIFSWKIALVLRGRQYYSEGVGVDFYSADLLVKEH